MQAPISAARTSLLIGITRNDDASIAHSAGTIPKTRIFRSHMSELRSGFQADGGTQLTTQPGLGRSAFECGTTRSSLAKE
jgi:hypothetical protein